ncbi:MAG: hypothetical protein GQ574_01505 [Crocinitomix sp.]|nr:hypothetical protein [Crocinitomix sp.]
MAKLTKEIAIDTTKEVLRRAFLPNALLVPLLILLHWIIISIWFAYNYDHQNIITHIIVGLLGGSFTILTFFFWGLRRFLIKAYLIIHYNIINLWLHPFCKNMADKILNNDLLDELEMGENGIVREWVNYLNEKSKTLPKIIQRIIKMVLRKVGYSDDLAYKIKLIVNKDTDEIAHLISDELSYRLIAASNRVVPAKIIYLIPINIILIILLWVFF